MHEVEIPGPEPATDPVEGRTIEPLAPRDRFTLQAERDFRASVWPVYRNSAANPRPEHIGSCLLLDIDGEELFNGLYNAPCPCISQVARTLQLISQMDSR